jgi:hypothetical protein
MSERNRGVATGVTKLVTPTTLKSDRIEVSVLADSWKPGDRFSFDETSVSYSVSGVEQKGGNLILILDKPMDRSFPTGSTLRKHSQ